MLHNFNTYCDSGEGGEGGGDGSRWKGGMEISLSFGSVDKYDPSKTTIDMFEMEFRLESYSLILGLQKLTILPKHVLLS